MKSAGPWGAISGPNSAMPATRITSPSPIRVRPSASAPRMTPAGRFDWTRGGSCATSGLSTAMPLQPRPETWSHEDRGDVGEQVEDHVEPGDQHGQGLDHRQVTVGHGVTERAADAGVVEDVLDE